MNTILSVVCAFAQDTSIKDVEDRFQRWGQERTTAGDEWSKLRTRWGDQVGTMTPDGRWSWGTARTGTSQEVIGDDACRGLVNLLGSGVFHYLRTVGFAIGDDVVRVLHNSSDVAVGGFDLENCLMGTLSEQNPTFFDGGARVVFVNSSPTSAGWDSYVDYYT